MPQGYRQGWGEIIAEASVNFAHAVAEQKRWDSIIRQNNELYEAYQGWMNQAKAFKNQVDQLNNNINEAFGVLDAGIEELESPTGINLFTVRQLYGLHKELLNGNDPESLSLDDKRAVNIQLLSMAEALELVESKMHGKLETIAAFIKIKVDKAEYEELKDISALLSTFSSMSDFEAIHNNYKSRAKEYIGCKVFEDSEDSLPNQEKFNKICLVDGKSLISGLSQLGLLI
jgi:hypothetical protein